MTCTFHWEVEFRYIQVNFMLANCFSLLTWLLIVWQHSCQSMWSQVWKFWSTDMDCYLTFLEKAIWKNMPQIFAMASLIWREYLSPFNLWVQCLIYGRFSLCLALQWRHNDCYGVSNHQPHDCLLNRWFSQLQIKENIKAPRHWPLGGEFTGHRWIPRTNGQWRGKCFHTMTSSL